MASITTRSSNSRRARPFAHTYGNSRADNLLAAEPANLDALINGAPTKKPVESDPPEENDG
jgi:hypothetical protein